MHLRLDRYETPVAPIFVVTDEEGNLRALEFVDHEARIHRFLRDHYRDYDLREGAAPKAILKALDAYFAGRSDALDDIPVATGGTEFQRKVWRALRKIPFGKTMSYGELAAKIGRPSASRAVGSANGSNPVAIVVPCHRVIGANGTLTGYGGGLSRKRWLLDHEQEHSGSEKTAKPTRNRMVPRTSQLRLVMA
jgi:methylated-DNA-[protein]-cysteine S-methyltransferase